MSSAVRTTARVATALAAFALGVAEAGVGVGAADAAAAPTAAFPGQFTSWVTLHSPEASKTTWGVLTSFWAYDIPGSMSRVDRTYPIDDPKTPKAPYSADFVRPAGASGQLLDVSARWDKLSPGAAPNWCFNFTLSAPISAPIDIERMQQAGLLPFNGTQAVGGVPCNRFLGFRAPIYVEYLSAVAGGNPVRFTRLTDLGGGLTRNETYVFSGFVAGRPAPSVFQPPAGCAQA